MALIKLLSFVKQKYPLLLRICQITEKVYLFNMTLGYLFFRGFIEYF